MNVKKANKVSKKKAVWFWCGKLFRGSFVYRGPVTLLLSLNDLAQAKISTGKLFFILLLAT